MDEFTYIYKPRIWHYFIPLVFFLFGYGLIHNLGIGWDVLLLACGAWVAGFFLLVWMTLAGIIQSMMVYHYQLTGEEYQPPKEKYYDRTQITDGDPRWRDWALAYFHGNGDIGRRKWTGMGKPFSKNEYSEKMEALRRINVLRFSNGRNSNNGYEVNGRAGEEYIKAMSEGRKNLPLPPSPALPYTREAENPEGLTARPVDQHQAGDIQPDQDQDQTGDAPEF